MGGQAYRRVDIEVISDAAEMAPAFGDSPGGPLSPRPGTWSALARRPEGEPELRIAERPTSCLSFRRFRRVAG
jgi:hypothetical protein